MTALELSPEVARAAAWADSQIDGIAFGEVTIRFVIHDARIAYVNREITEKEKLPAGQTGGHDAHRR